MILIIFVSSVQSPKAIQYIMEAVIVGDSIEGKDKLFLIICNNPDNQKCQLRLRNTWKITGQAEISINYDIMESTFMLQKADLALIILDLSREFATNTAKLWINHIKRNSNHADIVLIGMNSCDDSFNVDINHYYLYSFAKKYQLPYFPVDHNTEEGILQLRDHLYQRAEKFCVCENENLFSSVDISVRPESPRCC